MLVGACQLVTIGQAEQPEMFGTCLRGRCCPCVHVRGGYQTQGLECGASNLRMRLLVSASVLWQVLACAGHRPGYMFSVFFFYHCLQSPSDPSCEECSRKYLLSLHIHVCIHLRASGRGDRATHLHVSHLGVAGKR